MQANYNVRQDLYNKDEMLMNLYVKKKLSRKGELMKDLYYYQHCQNVFI